MIIAKTSLRFPSAQLSSSKAIYSQTQTYETQTRLFNVVFVYDTCRILTTVQHVAKTSLKCRI